MRTGELSRRFETTNWSVAMEAADNQSPDHVSAMDRICSRYWYPLYAFVRRRGYAEHDAEDLVQSFLTQVYEKQFLDRADREKGRFRTFLLVCLQRFLGDEHRKNYAVRRGGNTVRISIDRAFAEGLYLREIQENVTPEQMYDRRWATLLVENSLRLLQAEAERSGRASLIDQLRQQLMPESSAGSADESLGDVSSGGSSNNGAADAPATPQSSQRASGSATRVAVHRLRRRFREILRAEVARTVAHASDVDDEIRQIFCILASR